LCKSSTVCRWRVGFSGTDDSRPTGMVKVAAVRPGRVGFAHRQWVVGVGLPGQQEPVNPVGKAKARRAAAEHPFEPATMITGATVATVRPSPRPA